MYKGKVKLTRMKPTTVLGVLARVFVGITTLYAGRLLLSLCTGEACGFFTLMAGMTCVSFGVLLLILETVHVGALAYLWWRK